MPRSIKRRCPSGKVLNPLTNRCINRSGKLAKRMRKCPSGKVLNPLTDRCINRSGDLAKRIKRSIKRGIKRSIKRCPSGKVLNPLTNRCINRDGKVANRLKERSTQRSIKRNPQRSPKKIPQRSIKRSIKRIPKGSPKIILHRDPIERQISIINHQQHPIRFHPSRRYNGWQQKMIQEINPDWELQDLLGEGSFGTVFQMCNLKERDCRYVVKIENIMGKTRKEVKDEFDLQYDFYLYGLAPEPFQQFIYNYYKDKYAVTVMTKIDGSLESILEKRQSHQTLDDILRFIIFYINMSCDLKLIHGDLHWGNIGYIKRNNKIYLLLMDFGKSRKGRCRPELALFQLLRVASPMYTPSMNNQNRAYLIDKLKALIITLNPSFERDIQSQRQIETRYNKLDASIIWGM
jgi:hypothetical protein